MDVENKSMHEFATYSQFVQSKWTAGSGIWTTFSPRVVRVKPFKNVTLGPAVETLEM